MIKCYWLLLIINFSINSFGQNISFYAEDLDFYLTDSTFEVDGLYYFRNNSTHDIKQMLFYPFPDIEKYGEITFIKIQIEGDTTSMLATQSAKGSLFKVKIPANGEVAYRINYGQKLKSCEAKYIITTTQAWHEPFEFANYSLSFPETMNVDSVSISPDSTAIEAGLKKYFWQRKDFMPDRDFIFWIGKIQ
ncbi:MAG: hypothetical protein K9H16_05905 [Bacteroidales bacterium]|nr:hypothetical protein [Bacteroidales bacterium]